MPELPSRIAEIPTDKLSAEQSAVLKALIAGRGRLLTPYKIWLHSPKTAAAMEQLGTFLNKAGSLSEREVEIAIVLIAHHWQGEYVYLAHVRRSLELGWPQSVIDDIRANRMPPSLGARDRAIFEIARTSSEAGPASDEIYDRAVTALGRNGLAELLALIGYYSAVAVAMKLHRVPLPK